MRYRVIAKAVADRRRMLVVDDQDQHFILALSAQRATRQPLTTAEARRLQFDRAWVPALDHTPRTMRDLSDGLTYR
jgi:hypothetical protein